MGSPKDQLICVVKQRKMQSQETHCSRNYGTIWPKAKLKIRITSNKASNFNLLRGRPLYRFHPHTLYCVNGIVTSLRCMHFSIAGRLNHGVRKKTHRGLNDRPIYIRSSEVIMVVGINFITSILKKLANEKLTISSTAPEKRSAK